MAIKLPFGPLLFSLLLIFFQIAPTSQFHLSDPTPQGPGEPHYLPYKPRENSTFNVIDLELMSKALWDSDYKIMSLLLKRELPNLIPYGTDSSSELRLYDNNTITVFAPRDEAFRFELWMSVEYQVVLSKFDKEAIESGLVSEGLKMASCDCEAEYVVVSDVEDDDYQASASVNNVKVTRWNIYNDGHLIVHGVEDFFDPGFVYKNFLF